MENQTHQNYFFEHIKTYFAENDKDKIEHILHTAINDTKSDKHINQKQFELLGIFAFLFGIDYISQHKPNKVIIDRVKERFAALEIDEKLINTFIDYMHLFNPKMLDNVITELNKTMLNAEIENTLTANGSSVFGPIKMQLISLLNDCIVPIQYAVEYDKLKYKKLTFSDLLKINSLLNEDTTRNTGIIARRIAHLYSNEDFMFFLNKAIEYFNGAKYEILYKESLVSLFESMQNFELRLDYTDEEYDKFADEIKEKNEVESAQETEQNQNKKFTHVHQLTQEQFNDFIAENPHEFFLSVIEDANKTGFEPTSEYILKGIEAFVQDTDYVQNIFPFLCKHSGNRNLYQFENVEQVYSEVSVQLFNTVENYKAEYKTLAEIIFAEIDENISNRVIKLVKSVLENCYLSTSEQKQYVSSQLIQNGITTYNHLQQMISVIESCEILGKNTGLYAELYEYINYNETIRTVFESITKSLELIDKIKLYHRLYEWFTIKNKDTESDKI